MMETMILAHHLNKSYGDTRAVVDLNLRVSAGEIYGLVGPDGAGKTTTMRTLCGALQIDQDREGVESEIRIAGYDILRQTEQARALIGYLPQRFSLYEELTVMENIRFFAEVRGLPSAHWKPRCMQILEFVGLDQFTGRRAGFLSGGMKQKLGLAAALVHRPRVLLLDEPTTGVDPVTRQDFWQLIISLVANNNNQGNGVAVLVSTPYMDEAERAGQIMMLHKGTILARGDLDELKAKYPHSLFEMICDDNRRARDILAKRVGSDRVVFFGDKLHLALEGEKEGHELKKVLENSGIAVNPLRPISPGLEDLFIREIYFEK